VVVTGRSEARGAAVVEDIRAKGGEAIFARADVRREPEVEQVVATAVKTYGPPTILVNNAEAIDLVGRPGGVTEISAEDLDLILAVGLKGSIFFSKHMMRNVGPAGGSIVNISSTVSLRGFAGLIAYTATKGALNSLTLALAVEGSPLNVRCNCLILGGINNERMKTNPAFAAAMAKTRLTRVGEPEDVARAIAFLSSEAGGFITGALIPMDGGGVAMGPMLDLDSLLEERTR
jgi:NAD(P)-dependent dehydrogenase (short-subunit alcohol dehydrogenase family)